MKLNLLLAVIAVVMATGCASAPASLELSSTASGARFPQKFTRAFYSVGEGGEYNILLSEDGIVPAPSGGNKPIRTSAAAPLNQTVHIRVQWRPMRGVKPDAPTATNAVIDWYVRSNEPSGDHLHYRGAGFVQLYGSNPKIRFLVRNARMELTRSNGRLNDPLGPSALTGAFVATRNDAFVNNTLSQLREQLASNPTPARPASHDGPPPRALMGP
jgi:hypothetical protein